MKNKIIVGCDLHNTLLLSNDAWINAFLKFEPSIDKDSLTKDIFMAKQLGVKCVLFSNPAGMDPGFYEKLVAISSWTQVDFVREAQIKKNV